MPQTMNGAQLFARTLEAYGVTHVFFMDAVLRRALAEMEDGRITRILGHSEKAVAYMADGYARVSGRPGVCFAQSVGAANLAAALQDPYLGHSAVVAVTGRHVPQFQHRNAYQEVRHEPLYAAVTKFHAEIETLDQMQHLLRQAFREATSGTPRPVHLDIAGLTGDALAALEGEFDIAADEAHTRYPAFRPAPDPAALQRAVAAIARARRPVIVADRGVTFSGGEAALARLAERVQAAVVVTLDAKAAMLETHPLYRGVVGLYGQSCANHVVAEADLVVFAGSNVNDHTSANFKLPAAGVPVIQIDQDPSELGRNYPGTLGLLADVAAGMDALAAACAPGQHADWLGQSQKHVDAWRAQADAARAAVQVPMRPERLCAELGRALPEDAVVIADTGYSALWSGTLLSLKSPAQKYFRAAGSLGWAFPAALGAKCAAPERPVVCFTGDGGFYYHLPELETARRRGIKTVTVVNNNHSLSQGLRNLTAAYGVRDKTRMGECFEYRETDFARVAQAFDCYGTVVERPEDFGAAFDRALASDLPAVIDVRTEFGAMADLPWVPA
jgi:acetolactate synthase-1/2/3 large subunit